MSSTTRPCGTVCRAKVIFSAEDKLRVARRSTSSEFTSSKGAGRAAIPRTSILQAGPEGQVPKNAPCRLRKHAKGPHPARRTTERHALLEAGTPTVTIAARLGFHVTEILQVPEGEPRHDRRDDRFLKIEENRHYARRALFDGYRTNPRYSLATLEAAFADGAGWSCCATPTAGCSLEIAQGGSEAAALNCRGRLGIHTHNDGALPSPTPLRPSKRRAMVQGTINGYGERTGNAISFASSPTWK